MSLNSFVDAGKLLKQTGWDSGTVNNDWWRPLGRRWSWERGHRCMIVLYITYTPLLDEFEW